MLLSSINQQLPSATLEAAGISACLTKPVKPSQLFDGLNNLYDSTDFPKTTPAQTVVSAEPEAAPAKKSLRILLAEDNVVNQKVALKQLQKIGYSADAVANGLEVLNALKNIPYDLILMDCQMPEMDGYQATAQIRENEKKAGQRTMPIIAMTANAMEGDREKCLAAGMDDYISKPVRSAELSRILERFDQNTSRK